MKDILHLISEYSLYSNLNKLPSFEDALIHIERANLYVTYEKTKKGKKTGSGNIIGDICANYYVHGDASAYTNLANLVNRIFYYKSKDRNSEFFIDGGDINWGNINYTKGVVQAAAQRYTSAKCNKLLASDFDKVLNPKNNLVPFIVTKAGSDKSMPKYLPFIVPLGLIGNSISMYIGGLNSIVVPQYKLIDLLSRQYDLVTKGYSDNIIKPFIERNFVKEHDGAFEKLLTEGKGKVLCVPHHTIDDKKKTIIIRGMHPKKGFGVINKKVTLNTKGVNLRLFNAVHELKYGYPYCIIDDYTDKRTPEYNNVLIYISPHPKIKYDDDFKKKIIRLIGDPITFDCMFTDTDKKLKYFSIDSMLTWSFNDYTRIKKQIFENELNGLNAKLYELKVAMAIKDVYDNNIDRIRKDHRREYQTIIQIYTDEYAGKKYKFPVVDFVKILDRIKFKELVNLSVDIEPLEKQIISKQKEIDMVKDLSLKDLKNMISRFD